MLVSNLTSVDYWFGPLHLPANASDMQVDDTSETSLYLTSDTVADAINNLVLAGKISVSDAAAPFPRATGTPQQVNGDGSPEGLHYAPQGSLFIRRDNSGAGDALYAKTTGRTFSTGWQGFRVPVTSPFSGGPPASPNDGDVWIATNVDGNGTRWAFQYNANSTSSYKWEFIGGPDMWVAVTATEAASASGTWIDLATVGPSVTIERAGDYQVDGQASLGLGDSGGTNFYIGRS